MQHSLICTTLMMRWTLFIHILSNTHQQFKHFQQDPFTDTTKEVYSMDDNFFYYCTQGNFHFHFIFAPLSVGEFKAGRIQIPQIISLLTKLWPDEIQDGGKLLTSEEGQKLLGAKITMHTVFGQNNSDLLQSQTSQNIDIFYTIFFTDLISLGII